MIALGPSANLPPHIVLEACLSRVSLTLATILIAGLGLAGCDRGAPEGAQESSGAVASGEIDRSRAGALMPAVNLVDPAGRVLNLGALQGGPVLLNLWATWCAPCVKEMPLLDDLAGDYGEDLTVIAASQDLQTEKVQPFFEETGLEHLEPWIDPETQLSMALAEALPTTVLYDGAGREVWRVAGELDWSAPEIRAAIDEAVAAQ
ncbi:MAG: TlpA family protein disulfide reductase [Alphaproteobacteria bacterium]|nr:TlpA family protein disulfide reductase [Alphaproteobacteria bacterium]